MPWKFCDDIYNGSGVIVFTDKQTDKQTDKRTNTQTDTTENNSTLAARVVLVLNTLIANDEDNDVDADCRSI